MNYQNQLQQKDEKIGKLEKLCRALQDQNKTHSDLKSTQNELLEALE